MRVGPYDFRPGLLPTLATLLVLAGLTGLGYWQLDRAQTKRAVETAYLGRQALPPVALEEAPPGVQDRRYLRVNARGRYDPAHQFLLDNQVRRGQAGYLVLTPFLLEKDARTILVNRGWVPLGGSRTELPAIPVDEGPRRIQGLLAPPPAAGLVLGPAEDGSAGWPRVIERVETKALAVRLGRDLLPDLLLLDAAEAGGYLREWRPPTLGPERHIAYAIQWLALAGVLLLIYLRLNLRRPST